jgi:hypothetical protein
MNCPHCYIAFHDEWVPVGISSNDEERTAWTASVTKCPACKHETIRLLKRKSPPGDAQSHLLLDFMAYPRTTQRKPTPQEVPNTIRQDYEEACMVLSDSNKASAALSRRCLQAILRSQGYTQKDLAQQIDALLREQDPARAIPTALRVTVDAIRNFGNFSAHPVTNETTLQIIDVEPDEAGWCLAILEEMFDHYYVKPAQAEARKAALDAKLTVAGKPLSK